LGKFLHHFATYFGHLFSARKAREESVCWLGEKSVQSRRANVQSLKSEESSANFSEFVHLSGFLPSFQALVQNNQISGVDSTV